MLTNQRDCENRMAIMAPPSKTRFLIRCLSLVQGALDIDISTDTDGFCCRPRPILENRDTYFFRSKGIPLLIWLAMWCWPGGLVKHHPGRVTSACQNVSKSQEMAVNPPTHRSFTCYNLLEPACPSPLTLRSTNSAVNILTAHDFQHRGIGCSVWLPKMWTPSAPHNSDATFFLAHFLNTAAVFAESQSCLRYGMREQVSHRWNQVTQRVFESIDRGLIELASRGPLSSFEPGRGIVTLNGAWKCASSESGVPRVHRKNGRTSPEGILCWPMSFS